MAQQSPLNALMSSLPGYAMQLYQTQVQAKQKADDREYQEKQNALQRLFQKRMQKEQIAAEREIKRDELDEKIRANKEAEEHRKKLLKEEKRANIKSEDIQDRQLEFNKRMEKLGYELDKAKNESDIYAAREALANQSKEIANQYEIDLENLRLEKEKLENSKDLTQQQIDNELKRINNELDIKQEQLKISKKELAQNLVMQAKELEYKYSHLKNEDKWKNKEYELRRDELAQDMIQFNDSVDLEKLKLDKEDKRFILNYKQKEKIYNEGERGRNLENEIKKNEVIRGNLINQANSDKLERSRVGTYFDPEDVLDIAPDVKLKKIQRRGKLLDWVIPDWGQWGMWNMFNPVKEHTSPLNDILSKKNNIIESKIKSTNVPSKLVPAAKEYLGNLYDDEILDNMKSLLSESERKYGKGNKNNLFDAMMEVKQGENALELIWDGNGLEASQQNQQ